MALKNQDYFSEKYEKIEQAVLAAHSMGSFAVGIMAHYNVHFACEFSCVEVDVKTGKLSVSQLADTDSYSPGCKIIYKNRYVLWHDSKCVNDMYIINCRYLNDKNLGRPATEQEKMISGMNCNARAITECQLYDDHDWSYILRDKINTAVRMYNEIRDLQQFQKN